MQRSLEIANRYRDGDPIELIAHEYGVALSTVVKYARAFGLAPRIRRAGELAQQAQAIIADYAGGTPLKEMEQKYNVHRKALWRIVKDAGLPGRLNRKPREPVEHPLLTDHPRTADESPAPPDDPAVAPARSAPSELDAAPETAHSPAPDPQ